MKIQLRMIPIVTAVALTFAGACATRPASEPSGSSPASQEIVVSFDAATATGLMDWTQSNNSHVPESWKHAHVYELTREWAKWNQQPDPYSEIDRTLAEVRKSKSALKEIVKSRTLMDTVLSKRSAFSQSIIPTLVKYLPSGTSFKATVLFAAFIPPYSFSWGDGSIIINITDSYWRGSADKVLNLLAHEIYHLGFIAHQPGSSATDAHRSGEIIDFIVWRTQNEGMATYVASRCAPPGLLVEDYDLLDDPAQVRAKFDLLRSLIIEASDVDESRIPLVRTKAFQVGDMQRAFFVVGAHMARRIEQINGLDSLVNTVISGPRAFFATYAATKPPAGLSVNLP